jgi:hypothetical protein
VSLNFSKGVLFENPSGCQRNSLFSTSAVYLRQTPQRRANITGCYGGVGTGAGGGGIIKDEVRQEGIAKESFPVVRQRHK